MARRPTGAVHAVGSCAGIYTCTTMRSRAGFAISSGIARSASRARSDVLRGCAASSVLGLAYCRRCRRSRSIGAVCTMRASSASLSRSRT
jgi:hypothetical protein